MVSSMKRGGRRRWHRYKGFEGFLRRIAFNLGNTPSQTEVKIISCIPIDVTDLQEKIAYLERELEQANGQPDRTRSQSVYPLTVNSPRFRVSYPQKLIEFGNGQSNPDLCPPVDSWEHEYESPAGPQDAHLDLAKPRGKQDTAQAESRRGKLAIPKTRTHLVYCAQAETGSPFRNYEKVNTDKNAKLDKTLDEKYLSSILQRQYETGEVCEGLSQISAPVCRDVQPVLQADISEDFCSCCQGHFFDLDHTTCREMSRQPTYAQDVDRGNVYYDSNFYDVKPVKEKPNKINEIIKKAGSETDLTFYPEYYPFKPEYSLNPKCLAPHDRTKSIKRCPKKKYHTRHVFLQNDSSQTDGFVEFSHVYSRRLPPKHKSKLKPISRNAKCMVQIECNTGYINSKLIQTSSLSKLDLSPTKIDKPAAENNAYVDQTISNAKCPIEPTKPLQTVSMSQLTSTNTGLNKVTFKHAECLTLTINETECQTDPLKCAQSELVGPSQPDKTEATLEQIKSILQTVLTEVKTCQMQTIEEGKKTKDEIMQNESILRPDCERLLGSITYSPFAMNNPYQQMASCSRCLPAYCSSIMRQRMGMPPQAVEIPTDMGCVQNFPVFVHRTLATQACCSERSAVKRQKQTSTNTLQEKPKKRTPETETLIKEIYKSMAINVDCPIPTISCAAPDETKSTNVRKDAPNEFRTTNTMTQGREEIIYRGNVGTASPEAQLKEDHNSYSFSNMRARRRESFYTSPRPATSAMRREIQAKNINNPNDTAEVKEELAEFASDIENEVISHPSSIPTKPPKGFFGKVLSSVFKKMRKKEESDHDLVPQKPRRVKHVSYAPEQQPRGARSASPRVTMSKTRRLDYLDRSSRWEQDRRNTPSYAPRMPNRYAPRSALRAQPGSSQSRRAAHQPPAYPKSSTFDIRRYPQNLTWRGDGRPGPHEPFRPKPRATGIKLTNKTWMQKPVYHLGFACGPEKRKILMNY